MADTEGPAVVLGFLHLGSEGEEGRGAGIGEDESRDG